MKESNIWLINLPHAGGSSTVFKGWNKGIRCKVLNIEYPGHWTRMKEPLISSFDKLAEDVVQLIQEKIQIPADICLFGHSLGAIISWWIAPVLKRIGYNIRYMYLSASQSPNFFPEKSIVDAVSDIDKLKLIGYDMENYSQKINEQFIKTFFPILDNDLNICKSFVSDDHYVDVEAFVFYGENDELIEENKLITWENYVNLITICKFAGEHLYLEDESNRKTLIEIINRNLEKVYGAEV